MRGALPAVDAGRVMILLIDRSCEWRRVRGDDPKYHRERQRDGAKNQCRSIAGGIRTFRDHLRLASSTIGRE